MTRPGEFDIIERFFAPLAMPGAFSLKDDAALLPVPPDMELVVTQDAILEGVHFLADDPVDTIAHKALAVNVSDCVAKGAVPLAYSLALGLPDRFDETAIAGLAGGLGRAQDLFDVGLSGGDTYRSPERLAVSVTMFGTIPSGQYVSRLGARPGDVIAITNTIGNAALGLKVLQGELAADQGLIEAYRRPRPPFELAQVIRQFATAAMDVSDGLLGDCSKLLAASKCAGTIERDAVPLASTVQRLTCDEPGLWDDVLGGGDDYQILFTLPSDRADACRAAFAALPKTVDGLHHAVGFIGKVTDRTAGTLSLTVSGVPQSIDVSSYAHF